MVLTHRVGRRFGISLRLSIKILSSAGDHIHCPTGCAARAAPSLHCALPMNAESSAKAISISLICSPIVGLQAERKIPFAPPGLLAHGADHHIPAE